MADNYNIPLGIDPKGFLTGLDQAEAALDNITVSAKTASTAITEALTKSAQSGDALNAKLAAGANEAVKLKAAAADVGASFEKAFSAKNVQTSEITEKVNVFVAKMKDVIGKPISFKFNLDQASTDLLTSKLKDARGQMQSFQLVIDAANDRLKNLTAGSDAFKKLSSQIQDADKFLNVLKEDIVEIANQPIPDEVIADLGKQAQDAAPKTESLRSQIRQLREELAQMELAGQAGTERFIELSRRAGELQDQFGDTSQRVRALASDTQRLDAGIAAIRGLAGAFAAGQGALAAFGEQSEEAARAIQKVQGALAILQGIQEVANVLNKDSALSIYLQTYATRARTEAVVVETAAIATETVATEAATVATEAWTVALLANPITAIIAVLAVAAVALYEFSKAQKEGGLSAEQFNKALEVQNELLKQDYERVERSAKVAEARANAERVNQSKILEIQKHALEQKQVYDQIEIEEVTRHLAQLDREAKDYEKSREVGLKRIADLEQQKSNRVAEIVAAEIAQQRQAKDEQLKLIADELKERQANYEALQAIQKRAKDYAFEILNSRISDLKDGEQKEINTLRSGLAQKLQAIDEEAKANLKKLDDQRQNLQAEFDLADENGKKLISLQLANNAKQIQAEQANGEIRKELKETLTTSELEAERKIREKYANAAADYEFETQNILLNSAKESSTSKIKILEIAAQQEIALVERTNQSVVDKNDRIDAINKKLAKDKIAAELDYNLQRLSIEKTANENLINEAKNHGAVNTQVQEYYNILLLKNEQDNARAQLDLLIKSGKDLSSQEVVNAKARVLAADGALKGAVANKTPQTLASLLFPDASDKEQASITQNISTAFTNVSKAVDDYTSLVIDRYQRIVDAKRELVKQDDEALDALQQQLQTEQALRDKGYASNVAGVQAELAAKTAAREKDVKAADEAQKKLEKVQRNQANAQTALQLANLLTSATNIYLATSQLGPAGVIAGGIAISAMFAAFVAARAKASEAINAGVSDTTKFEKGGQVKGKSHAQGGQRYFSADGSAGVLELEDGEFVVRKSQTEKYKPLLEVINNNSTTGTSEVDIKNMLAGLGIHMNIDDEHAEALRESRMFTTKIIAADYGRAETPAELKSIDQNIQRLVDKQQTREETYEESGFIVKKKGNKTIRIRKN